MANEKQRKTFLSYSRVNTDFAKKLAKELKAEGFPVWLDQLDIPAGSRWDREVEKALKECEIFMIIMTPASIDSENVLDEIGYAIDTGKRLLPVLLENCEVPFRLRRFQYVDFTNKDFEDGVESAKQLLRGLIAQDTIPRGQVPTDTQKQIVQAKAKQKTKEDAERIGKRTAEEELAAKAEADRKVKAESDSFKASRENVIKASDLLAQGKKLFEDKSWAEAATIFRQVLTLTPNHPETKNLLANVETQILQESDELAAKTKADTERKAKEEADRLAAQKAEADKLAKQTVEADRLAKQKTEDERLAKVKAETEREAKEDADRLALQKAEADKLAKQKAEEERLAKIKAEAERKEKEEADRLAKQKVEDERLTQAKAETEHKEKEEADHRAAQKTEADKLARAKPAPVIQANEKTAGKKSMTKGMVIGGSVGVVFCIVAVFAIVSWMNNTVSPTDTPLKVTATKPKSTATIVSGSTKIPTKISPTLTSNIPITTLEGTWIGKMEEIDGDRIFDVRLSVNKSLNGEVVLDGPNHEEYSIVEGSWDGYNFWFKDDQEFYYWGTYENGHLVGGFGFGLEYLYWYTFDLTR